MPIGLTSIGIEAFANCSSLTSITFLGSAAPTSIGTGWIDNTPAGLQGHANAISNFPATGNAFNGLMMGSVISSNDVVPGAPSGLTAQNGPGYVLLSWLAPADQGSPALSRYDVYRSDTASNPAPTLIGSSAGTLTCNDTTARPGQSYYYTVKVVNTAGSGPASNGITGTANIKIPSAPQNLKVTFDNGSATITWSPPADNGGSNITSYDVFSAGSEGGYVLIATLPSDALSYVDQNGSSGKMYYVAAVNINVGTVCDDDDAEFYLIMVDRENNEQSYFACGKAEVCRKEKTWEVMLYDGRKEVSLGVEDSSISSKKGHLYLFSKNGRILCRDLGSRNGIYLNGKRVKDHDEEAVPGDLIRVGSSLTFRLETEQNVITVKKNALTPIPKDLADRLAPDQVIEKDGRLYLNGVKLDGNELEVDGTRIKLEDIDFRKSVHLNRELLGVHLPDELVRALIQAGLQSSGKASDQQIDDLSRKMDSSSGKDKEQLQKRLLDRLGDMNAT